jgi:competence protein ComEC
VVDRASWRRHGAMALRRVGDRFEITSARPVGHERPWTRATAVAREPPEAGRTPSAQARDATPRPDDLEAGD